MPEAISNTSPLLYLHRIGALEWLPRLFNEIWAPASVAAELEEGRRLGYDVPDLATLNWVQIVEPKSIPAEWLVLELGRGELAAMAIALENPGRIVLLDDGLARRTARAAGLQVWGTLKIMLSYRFRPHPNPLPEGEGTNTKTPTHTQTNSLLTDSLR